MSEPTNAADGVSGGELDLDAKKDDYRGKWGCACDVPLPTDAGVPRPGWCYCAPTAAEATS